MDSVQYYKAQGKSERILKFLLSCNYPNNLSKSKRLSANTDFYSKKFF